MIKINLMRGDCLERMKELESESIDLVVTSPPYDNLRTYNDSNDWSLEKFKPIAKELSRVIKKGGVIVWNVADATVKGSETGSSFRQALFFKDECGLNIHDTMIWAKPGFSGIGSLTRYHSTFEYMFILSKGPPKTFSGIFDRENKSHGRKITGTRRDSKDRPKRVVKHGGVIAEFGLRFNVWNMPPEMNRKIKHPAPFPVRLVSDHIFSWSKEGDWVLDPFMGSGSTGVACKNTGRNFIGIERDDKYFEIAEKRILSANCPLATTEIISLNENSQ